MYTFSRGVEDRSYFSQDLGVTADAEKRIKAAAITEFIGRLSVTYRKLSAEGVDEVIRLGIDEFGVDAKDIWGEDV